MGVEKPGFFDYLGGYAKILAETRFLVFSRSGGDTVGSISAISRAIGWGYLTFAPFHR
ncbi:MAG: hypothetical protein GDA43_23455 [Hormoscilla sp. SP5CHS1]|nr:hypothetical protein [Hormoscilla sp. SP5CHS1]